MLCNAILGITNDFIFQFDYCRQKAMNLNGFRLFIMQTSESSRHTHYRIDPSLPAVHIGKIPVWGCFSAGTTQSICSGNL